MKKEETKNKLLKIGAELMSIKGYHGVGLKEILDNAQVPKGSFYHYFKSKEDFAIEIIKLNFELKHQFLIHMLQNNKINAVQRLKNLITEYKKIGFTNDSLLVKMITEMANLNKPIKKCLQTGVSRSKEIISDCLQEAQNNDEISTKHDIKALSEFILSGWEGAIMRSKLIGSKEPLEIYYDYLFQWILI